MDAIIHISFLKIFEFEGWKFEHQASKPFGPWPVKNDLEPRARAGKKFYDMFDRFNLLTNEQQNKLRIL